MSSSAEGDINVDYRDDDLDELCNQKPAGERWDPLGAPNDQEDECSTSLKDDYSHGISQR